MTVATHPDDVPHFLAAYLLLQRDGKFLLMRRKNTSYMDGYYGVPAGRVMHAEPITDTAVRELKEETGITISVDKLNLAHILHRYEPQQDYTKHWVDFFYTVDDWTGEPVIAEPHKADDIQWLSSDSDEKIVPYVRNALRHVEQKQFFSLSGEWAETHQNAA